MAPERRNVWKVIPAPDQLSLDKIKEKCLLTLVSVSGTQSVFHLTWNRGKFEPLRVNARVFDSTRTGQIGVFSNLGIEINFTSLFFCMVFDHLIHTEWLFTQLCTLAVILVWHTQRLCMQDLYHR